ncbi:hypothetical protein HDU99_001317 [Rhizoclosmatium hyalinum]|nr:hypothetical protein HDU99_001317 [Rhizoclosmatium hyalinum]
MRTSLSLLLAATAVSTFAAPAVTTTNAAPEVPVADAHPVAGLVPSPTPVTQLVGVAADGTFWRKTSIDSPSWSQMSTAIKGIDVIDYYNSAFYVIGKDNYIYNCRSLSVWDDCFKIANSGPIKSLALYVLNGIPGYVGVQMDGQLVFRSDLSTDWIPIPGSGTVIDITVLSNPSPVGNSLLGTGPDLYLYTRQNLTAPWVFVPGSCCVYRTVQFPDGSIVGVGTDNQLYQTQSLSPVKWSLIPNSGSVVSVTPRFQFTTTTVLLGIAADGSLWGKNRGVTTNWIQVAGPKALDLIQLPDLTFVVVGQDNNLYNCQTLVQCTLVPNSGRVKSIDYFRDLNPITGKRTFLGVGMDNQLYTRSDLDGPWVYVPNSGTVVDVTITSYGSIIGTAPDGNLYTKQTLNAPWVIVPNSCCVSRTAQFNYEEVQITYGVGGDQIYTKSNLNANWVLVPNSKSVANIAIVKLFN